MTDRNFEERNHNTDLVCVAELFPAITLPSRFDVFEWNKARFRVSLPTLPLPAARTLSTRVLLPLSKHSFRFLKLLRFATLNLLNEGVRRGRCTGK